MKKNDDWYRNDPKFWKLGIFYFNPSDKELFVPKRTGLGMTLNFANANAILIVAGLLILIIYAMR